LWYHPDISIITGIAYDHINVFPTYDLYLSAFADFIATHKKEDEIIWFEGDLEIEKLMKASSCTSTPYRTPEYEIKKGKCSVKYEGQLIPLEIIGEHNLQNMESARIACNRIGIEDLQFLEAMSDFSGAGRRMEKIYDRNEQVVYRDFAHSPSKLKATINAVRSTYTGRPLLAVFELHTFSSLNEEFLPHYEDSMKESQASIVYMDPEVFRHKNKEPLSTKFIKSCFGDVEVITSKPELIEVVNRHFYEGYHLLLMSSGTFSGAKFNFP
jgi:UDP-N-acetylmuramate: L-alanyl-gamma-D-glutamyl-meso-diaminopimelate ligase